VEKLYSRVLPLGNGSSWNFLKKCESTIWKSVILFTMFIEPLISFGTSWIRWRSYALICYMEIMTALNVLTIVEIWKETVIWSWQQRKSVKKLKPHLLYSVNIDFLVIHNVWILGGKFCIIIDFIQRKAKLVNLITVTKLLVVADLCGGKRKLHLRFLKLIRRMATDRATAACRRS
jgi:hypothetical protein